LGKPLQLAATEDPHPALSHQKSGPLKKAKTITNGSSNITKKGRRTKNNLK
jgi:hypothetical protein